MQASPAEFGVPEMRRFDAGTYGSYASPSGLATTTV
jgi:hypothetical protein